ncbi:hypothetical protein [Amycolatopsis sp. CA-230715]|uniref:hypothetical protein n=1 Tax=Amycolatopsis sp. CA-230715 TaxID=2745196 RepID=UPI001C00B07F|nr:hypothetical protein [Amycolatopsis sp. CA-230715]QWF82615.1 hypothetical protein HUW46_06054 [Amycolatopsis sp. CA-230715]
MRYIVSMCVVPAPWNSERVMAQADEEGDAPSPRQSRSRCRGDRLGRLVVPVTEVIGPGTT